MEYFVQLIGGRTKKERAGYRAKIAKYLPEKMQYWANVRILGRGDAIGIKRAEGEVERDRRDNSYIRVS